MSFSLYDYVNQKGENAFKEWAEGLQKVERAKLNERLDKLALNGESLLPLMLSDTNVPGIRKLKIKGKVQLRPLLCRGPVDVHSEYTMLLGAIEKGDAWLPKRAPETALTLKNDVINDPTSKRKKHERVT